jgi:hypothetical protein
MQEDSPMVVWQGAVLWDDLYPGREVRLLPVFRWRRPRKSWQVAYFYSGAHTRALRRFRFRGKMMKPEGAEAVRPFSWSRARLSRGRPPLTINPDVFDELELITTGILENAA